VAFDFKKMSKNKSQSVVDKLAAIGRWSITRTGLFHSHPHFTAVQAAGGSHSTHAIEAILASNIRTSRHRPPCDPLTCVLRAAAERASDSHSLKKRVRPLGSARSFAPMSHRARCRRTPTLQ
jgi:hypothetical protein